MFHSIKTLSILSFLVIISCATKAYAQKIDMTGFEEMTPDEFRDLLVGKALAGVNKGTKYRESFTPDGRINGEWGGTPYSGKWAAGKNNCLLLTYYWQGNNPTRCWKVLRKDGVYVFGRYNSDGSVLTNTDYVNIVD